MDQHEENQTRESDSVHGGNDGADDGVEKTQLRHEQVFERVGVAGYVHEHARQGAKGEEYDQLSLAKAGSFSESCEMNKRE